MSAKTILTKTILNLRFGTARLALLFAGLFVLPIVGFTASASAAYSDCSPGNLCVWKDANASGTRWSWGGNWSGTCWNMIPSANDVISSVYNNMSSGVMFFTDAGCPFNGPQGNRFYVGPGVAASTGQDPFVWYFNDTISSVYFY